MTTQLESKLFINNEFVASSQKTTVDNLNPATGEKISILHIPSKTDIHHAVEAAHQAFHSKAWREKTAEERAKYLEAISEKMKERKNELIDCEVKDSGSCLRKAKADVHNAASYFKVLAGQLRKFAFEIQDNEATRAGFSKNFRRYEPVGVCAQIIPWNFPLVMAAWKIGPVIASGCTTVLKTAQETPMSALILAEIIRDCGLPAGVINVISGGATEGEELISNPKVKKIAFTGSTPVGKKIMQKASVDLKLVSLELGGKSANIICADADLSMAIDGALYAFLYHSGQACDSGTRLLVDEKIWPTVKPLLIERAKQVKVGLPHDPAAGYGPVISKKQYETIMGYIQSAQNEGAELLTGGKRVNEGEFSKGYYIEPTVFYTKKPIKICREEIFGPVLAVMTFKTEEEAITLANDSDYGLAGAVWSKDEARALNLAKQLEAGTVWVNEYHLLNPGMPFGGYKQSGLGREMGEEGLKAYLEVKHLWVSDCNERSKKPWMDVLF
jgi:acyl-CoA reductase-like NAD-dependent aldehyde dehydrogenase